ncbi:hypothetical protein PF004_g28996, partial [Phytophthora fragariae]
MDKSSFERVVNKIKDNPVFYNDLPCPQAPVWLQLAVALDRFGNYGSGASLSRSQELWGIGKGTVDDGERMHVTSVLVSVVHRTVVQDPPARPTPPAPKPSSNHRPAKRPKTSPTSTAAHKHPAAKAQKKKTKKQMNEEAKQRRRELAALDKVWGHRNITDADGKSVEPPPTTPASTASPPPRAEPSDADETGDADVEGISSSGYTDACALARTNADTDRPALADNADQDAGVPATADVNNTALATNADTGESAAATAGAGCSLAETHANVDISSADSESSVAFRSADVDSTRDSNGDDEHYSSDESVEEVTADSQ